MTSFSKKLSQKWEKQRQKRKEKRANKPRKPVNISRRVYLLFGVVFVLFLLLFARLTYMQVYNKSFYTKKLEDNSKYTVRIASERGQIFDAKGVALTTNQSKDVITFTRSNLVSSDTMKKVAEKLATMVTLTETKVTARQKRDFYLADSATYKRVVNELPNDKKTDKFGNKLAEATIYNNAVDAVPDEAVDYSAILTKRLLIGLVCTMLMKESLIWARPWSKFFNTSEPVLQIFPVPKSAVLCLVIFNSQILISLLYPG